jgi:hypothetical protein
MTTQTTTDLTIPGPAIVELRFRLDALNKILADLVGRIRNPLVGNGWAHADRGEAWAGDR